MSKPRILNPVILLRTAVVLMFIHFAGHTVGMFGSPSHGSEEVAVLDTMKTHHFDMMGSSRSYWDFLEGFGFDASLNMLLQSVLLWFLAGLAKQDPAAARPFVGLLALVWLATIFLYLRYFFAAPIVFAIVMAVVLSAAWLSTKSPSSNLT